ncbi:MAG: flavodoxin [Methanobacterium sp.]|nr:flavodoxin [Methanobacterium sp.]
MKTLVIYFSRTGNTQMVAEEIANALGCDTEEIIDTKSRSGILGWIRSGRDAGNKSLTVLEDPVNDPADYDLLVIGTPTWGGHVSTPVRTYISQKQAYFNNVAFFCTAGGDKFAGVFMDMTDLAGTSPMGTLGVSGKDIKSGNYQSKVQDFVKEIQM